MKKSIFKPMIPEYPLMRQIAFLALFLFTVRVAIPMGEKRTYTDIVTVKVVGEAYELTTQDHVTIYVPVQFTIIEEKRS